MKIIDCFMYFDEDLLLDLRLNILNKYVDKFIICEASYNHKGIKKKLNFDISKFSKFRSKINYIILEEQPDYLKIINNNDSEEKKNSKILFNSINRDIFQRNYLLSEIKKCHDEDMILISDLDEIPNLENINFQNKINFFCQKMFYYKFNLIYPNFVWYGTKGCKKKYFITPQWLRNIKSKNYSWWRLDVFFSNQKYLNINFIKNGGWHFTNLKRPEDLHHKMSNFAHHLEYEESGIGVKELKEKIKQKKIIYNHHADKKDISKWNSDIKLEVENDENLPKYLISKKNNYSEWFS